MARAILVGYDDHPAAKRALERAIEEAERTGDRVLVLAVFELPVDPDGNRSFGTAGDSTDVPQVRITPPEVEEMLGHARQRVEAAGVAADYLWSAGDPAVRIVGAAKSAGARAVVLGSHHHTMLGSLFGADVVKEVRRRAGCEVIVVD